MLLSRYVVIKVLSGHFPRTTEVNHKDSVYVMFQPKYEPNAYRIHV